MFVAHLLLMLLLRRAALLAAEFCGSSLGGTCGVKTSAAVLRELRADFVVTYEQLKVMLSSGSVQLFDVRGPDEFQAGRIPGSANIPLGDLEEALRMSPRDFEKRFEVDAPHKEDDNIVFHCQTGRRSTTALHVAHGLGFARARHYAGGYSEWAEREGQPGGPLTPPSTPYPPR
ncbi:thiosulfate sulfurtransferase/rhodanese-like domain-containing protein 1-like [Scleropages formosus]|uniref:Thiosulfate sulfurtransferase/rhodanese-like domain-containing protein 1-like n=1 Tax=Scleropages formosus TaxID=113540 RepID=A0A0P7V3B8_SCLFO|nr:thiosulfate sulfurtransferase/rhodanese-like domain-containing protein 1-like [Scleropages formosus]